MTTANLPENSNSFYNPFDLMSFTYDRCFLCGKELGESETVEHVLPKWLQNKYNLWNQKVALQNETEIRYRQLTIPCCTDCNNNHLSALEEEIAAAVNGGYTEFCKLDELKIYQWVLKIFFGILFKELSLQIDLKNPEKGQIMSPELLKKYWNLHGFLQSIRLPFKFGNFQPWSIFLFETHEYGDGRDFDYNDKPLQLTFSIRMGSIGIIACLDDNGAQKAMFAEFFDRFKGVKVHPIQFDELSAKVTYKSLLMIIDSSYVTILPEKEGNEILVLLVPGFHYQSGSLYDEWDNEEFARILALDWGKWGLRFEDIYREPGMVMTYLENEDDTLKIMDADGNMIAK